MLKTVVVSLCYQKEPYIDIVIRIIRIYIIITIDKKIVYIEGYIGITQGYYAL
jgi:hypothetical protein